MTTLARDRGFAQRRDRCTLASTRQSIEQVLRLQTIPAIGEKVALTIHAVVLIYSAPRPVCT